MPKLRWPLIPGLTAGGARAGRTAHPPTVSLSGVASGRDASLRDLDKPFLHQLRHSCHRIRVDLDPRQHIRIPPLVDARGRPAQLDLDTSPLQLGDEYAVRIAGGHIAFGV